MKKDFKEKGGVFARKIAADKLNYPLPQERACTNVDFLTYDHLYDDEDAVKYYKLLINNLIKVKLILETMKYKRERLLKYDDTMSVQELTEELLCVNAPLLPNTLQKMKRLFMNKASLVLFRGKPYILFHCE